MATRRPKNAAAAAKVVAAKTVVGPACAKPMTAPSDATGHLFSRMACQTALFAGKPISFLTAAGLVVVWALTGPLFGFSDTWQLVINTSTTIVTFLMVFLIQHTQNRDTLALQLKLAELIIAAHGAKNSIATAEDLSVEELEALHESYRKQAEHTLIHLKRKRTGGLKQPSELTS